MAQYIERIRQDLRVAGELHPVIPHTVDSIYLGGGTPSLLPPDLLRAVFVEIKKHFQITDHAEITVECAPGQLADDALDAMLECGVNRISFGVQSFIDLEAKATGRLHTRSMALDDIQRVRRAGIARINADLIAGLPHQTAASWEESLAVLVDSGVDHASIYMLEVDEDSRLGREVLKGGIRYYAPTIPSDDAIADMYVRAIDVLAKSGMAQYEISNFARLDAASSHNQKYWMRQPYLGLGVDAHSMLRTDDTGAIRFATTDDLQRYLTTPDWDEVHSPTQQEELEEAWFLSLRLNAGANLRRIEDEFGREAVELYRPILEELSAEGFLTIKADQIVLTLRGQMLSNEVFARFLDVIENPESATV